MMKRREKRFLRNNQDCHNVEKEYPLETFGHARKHEVDHSKPVKLPSELLQVSLGSDNAVTLLNPHYQVQELQTLRKILAREHINKKDILKQTLFTPNILLYVIFVSEDDILLKYLHYWKRYQNHIQLKIPSSLINQNLRPGCSCSGCFGACVRLAHKYNLLPSVIDHQLMTDEINRPIRQ